MTTSPGLLSHFSGSALPCPPLPLLAPCMPVRHSVWLDQSLQTSQHQPTDRFYLAHTVIFFYLNSF